MTDKTQSKDTLDQLVKYRHRLRHSTAHIMADAVLEIFPQAKLAIGPPIEHGFYYDFDIPRTFTPEDLVKVEEIMKDRISQNLPFERREMDLDNAKEFCKNEPYKLQILEDLAPDQAISFYRHGEFEDLCEGPHVESTGEVSNFKILSSAGAYWRGDETQPMLQRIYGTAFESQETLAEYLRMLEEAEGRDHRRLGKQLGLYSMHEEVGPGLVILHPNGARLRTIIENYWRDLHYRRGYELVYSPHIGRSRLWETSGHLDFFSENMYSPMEIDGQQYYMKPMNCPFHIMVYKSDLRSYRELPMRLGELGTVYRYERSGVLHGLMRVRGLTQDDAHIFCRPEQVESEVLEVMDLAFEILDSFGFKEYKIYLSTKPEKAVGEPQMWDRATESLRKALDTRQLDYEVDEGGGAFYGPKIDIKISDSLKREWQCSTVQFDFNLPERFDLTFRSPDGGQQRPFMVHRTILGAIERFLGILIEHYGGAFPFWISPVQVMVIPIADRHLEYANNIAQELMTKGFRTNVDSRNERMNLKIRESQLQKVPYMLVIGNREVEQGSISVRHRERGDLGSMSNTELMDILNQEERPQ